MTTTTATPTPTTAPEAPTSPVPIIVAVPETPATVAALEAVALLDQRLAEWGQTGRSLVPATDVVDLALDLRRLLAP